jgi:hypothetical protein
MKDSFFFGLITMRCQETNLASIPCALPSQVIIVKRFGSDDLGASKWKWGWPDLSNSWEDDQNKVVTNTSFGNDHRFYLQDNYDVGADTDRKERDIEATFKLAAKPGVKKPKDLILNFASMAFDAKDLLKNSVLDHAKEVNKWMNTKLNECSYQNAALGIVVMDYVWLTENQQRIYPDVVPLIIYNQHNGSSLKIMGKPSPYKCKS